MDAFFSQESFIHATSGAVGGNVAYALCYPIDQVRNALQLKSGPDRKKTDEGENDEEITMAQQFEAFIRSHEAGDCFCDILEKKGLGGLYQGLVPGLQTLFISNFIYFYCYIVSQATMKTINKSDKLDPKQMLFAGALAGVVNMGITEPMWKCAQILRNKDSKEGENLLTVMSDVANREGVLALWNGLPISLWLVSNPIIQFFTYDSFKNYLTRRDKTNITALEAFFLGALAKAVATVFTYPLQVAQTRLRTSKKKSDNTKERGSITEEHYRGIIHCLEILYRTRGLKGLFQGIEAKLGQTVLTAAFMFMFYEKIAAGMRAALTRK